MDWYRSHPRASRYANYANYQKALDERAKESKCQQPYDRPEVAKRLVSIIAAQRRGHARPVYGRTSGHIDHRNLWKASTGDNRVFSKPGAASPTRIRLVVLMDLSGSMTGDPATKAAQMCWDLICAAVQVPTVTLEVWGHTTGMYVGTGEVAPDGVDGCQHGSAFIKLVELWKHGYKVKDFWEAIVANDFGGTEDGWVQQTLAHDVEQRLQPGERMVLVIVSDGEPAYQEGGMEHTIEHGHVRGVVNAIRRRGHAVISVACSDELRRLVQANMYGDGNVVEYTYDTNVLTQNIARVIGRALN